MKINCIVIDDEPLARKGIEEYVAEVDFLQLLGGFENPLKAMDRLAAGDVQLVFLDIQMPKLTGLDFMRAQPRIPPVIFTTAYPQYALEGFELNALDYLVKPIAFDRFYKAALRAREYYELRDQNLKPAGQDFFIKADGRLIRISLHDILYAEALQNYVVIQTDSHRYITYLTFKSVEEFLPADMFIRIHKSYLVSASRIDSIEGNMVRMGTHSLPISRTLKDEVMERLLKGKFLKR